MTFQKAMLLVLEEMQRQRIDINWVDPLDIIQAAYEVMKRAQPEL